MTKTVIFVGGTSYSGSTFFHLTLANDPKGFGIGEVNHLFRPTREKHARSTWVCGCGDPDCTLWRRVKPRGEERLYESIFEMHPDAEFIVDASKNVVWIDEQSRRLIRQGYQVRHILIWKTLAEYAHSLQKRNRLDNKGELANWPRYHRTFYSFMDEFRAVKYADYTRDQACVLQACCDYLGIPYFDGKERFWERTHHVLGGNLSSRIHLYARESDRYQDVQRRAQGSQRELTAAEANYRRVYYERPDDKAIQGHIAGLQEELPYLDQIEEMLSAHDVRNAKAPDRDWPDLKLSPLDIRMRQFRQHAKERIGKIRYAN